MAVIGTVYGDDKVIARLQAMPSRLRIALSNAMKTQWYALQRAIVSTKLSGQVLKRKTGVLASSINVGGPMSATEFIDQPAEIIGRVGTRVWYGAVHEYGGSFTVKGHERTISQAFGRPISPRTVSVRSYTANFPERSFLRSGLQDRSAQIRDAIASSIKESLGV